MTTFEIQVNGESGGYDDQYDEETMFEPTEHAHRRYNPLMGKHVLVSPHRTKRPWKGQTEAPVLSKLPPYDEECYLCPGNARSGGAKNPDYKETFVFENDFPALLSAPLPLVPSALPSPAPGSPAPNGTPTTTKPIITNSNTGLGNANVNAKAETDTTSNGSGSAELSPFFDSRPVRGRCKVICFHPRHDLTLARMDEGDIVSVVKGWKQIYEEEGEMLRTSAGKGSKRGGEGYVQIFENRGAMMGASAPHPHGQVWSLSYVPDEPATELLNLSKYSETEPAALHRHPCGPGGKACMLCAYAADEFESGERVVEVDESSGWMAVVPFWATWPYEILILPYKRHISSLCDLSSDEQLGLAKVLKRVLVRYDNLFSCPFPYSMGIHQSPLPPRASASDAPRSDDDSIAHIHFHFYPPLLRSASVRKFLVGFEMMSEAQRDLTPEQAAERLRALDDVHYLEKQQS